jgi:hypothetical protein
MHRRKRRLSHLSSEEDARISRLGRLRVTPTLGAEGHVAGVLAFRPASHWLRAMAGGDYDLSVRRPVRCKQ